MDPVVNDFVDSVDFVGLSEFLSMLLTIWPSGVTFKLIYSGFSLCFETLNG